MLTFHLPVFYCFILLSLTHTHTLSLTHSQLNTSADAPLGLQVEGGSDTHCPYITISSITPGSLGERCNLLRVGDELVEVDDHLMVGSTHKEAVAILEKITKPVTLTVQRRNNFDAEARIKSRHSLWEFTGGLYLEYPMLSHIETWISLFSPSGNIDASWDVWTHTLTTSTIHRKETFNYHNHFIFSLKHHLIATVLLYACFFIVIIKFLWSN